MKQSETIANLAAALATVQQHVVPVTKDRTNPHFKNNYATLDAIMESVRPLLAGHGLAIVQGGGSPITDSNGVVCGTSVETMLIHTSGEFISSAIILPVERPSPQTVGSAITYGRRYGVAALLALTTEEDDDGNHATATVQHAAPRVAAPARVLDKAGVEKALDMAPEKAALALDEESCPKCGGRMWDNRLTKKNPKAPNFKCRDRSCDGCIWPPKDGESAKPALATVPERDEFPPFDDADAPPF